MSDKKYEGTFSLGLLSLQLQTQHLFQDCGGDRVVRLLDCLSNLPPTKRDVILTTMLSIVETIVRDETNAAPPDTQGSAALHLEKSLYEALLGTSQIQAAEQAAKRLSVVDGGKSPRPFVNQPISLDEVRRARKKEQAADESSLVN